MFLMPQAVTTIRTQTPPKRLSVVAISLAIVFVLASMDLSALAQERSTLVRMLGEARDFRVRARAALALGSTGDASAVPPLSTALRDDDSPAVRAAAASALGTLGSSEALPALRAAGRDGSSDVREAATAAIRALSSATASAPSAGPSAGSSAGSRRMPLVEVLPPSRDIDWAHTSYAVVMGSMENRSSFTHTGLASMLQHQVHRGLIVLRGVAILESSAGHPEASREITRRRIPSFRMEGSIATIHRERRDGQTRVRCDVSILVMDEPGRNLRASLNASSTAMADAASSASARTAQERLLAEQALEAAAERAMGGAARALSSSR
jgi:hypothetical protein